MITWHAVMACDNCGIELHVASPIKAPCDGTAVRMAGQNAGWATKVSHRGSDLCAACVEAAAA